MRIVAARRSRMATWNCPLCIYFAAPTMKQIVRHIGAVHSHRAGFRISCGISGCPRTYKRFHSYRQHLLRNHRETLDSGPSSINSNEDINTSLSEAYSEDETDWPECEADQPDILTTKQACLFLLKAKEIYKVSECNLNPLIGDISIIVDSTVRYLERKVGQALMEKGILLSDELSQVFHSPQLFHGLQSEYLRKKYIKNNMVLVVREYSLNFCVPYVYIPCRNP